MRFSIVVILLGLFIPAIGGAACTSACRDEQSATAKASRIDGSYRRPDGKQAVIPKFKGAMSGAKPTLYQPRHPKHPTFAKPLTLPAPR